MSCIKLTVEPKEGGTYKISVAFATMAGVPFSPKTCHWSLTDMVGNIINDRYQVAKVVSGTSEDFIIFGDDLMRLSADDDFRRLFTVQITFDATFDGIDYNDLPDGAQVEFSIAPLEIFSATPPAP